MKHRIFNNGKGWYISATNYKDEKDKAYMGLYFPNNSDPEYRPSDKGYACEEIDIVEGKFNCYKGKINLTVFTWNPVVRESTNNDVQIDQDELPFY